MCGTRPPLPAWPHAAYHWQVVFNMPDRKVKDNRNAQIAYKRLQHAVHIGMRLAWTIFGELAYDKSGYTM